MTAPRILAFAGSVRINSFNGTLVRIAAAGARRAGADVTVLDLNDFPLPIFDEDFEREQGTPANAQKLKELFLQHDGLLVSSPEYNSSISPLLKNTIDWVSRPIPGQPRLAAYRNKFAALMSASPGALGGLRGLVHVRAILGNIGVTVLANQVAIGHADSAFDSSGQLRDESQQVQILDLGRSLAEVLAKLQGQPSPVTPGSL
ncbi:MAG: NAD(P)H-dependent oxidoreductase [Planctomycetaceae bacterium]